MSPAQSSPTGEEFVSLYRRYRPGRFSELRGQDHVVRALRTAVRDGHVGHAYLFSGPRGTGKTSTARILAKALNCDAPIEGDPCGVCSSCLEITKGTSMDVIELDAASNNGVEAIRDLISHAALGSPGRSKVYIIDEVHMLSRAASNALLKTLEEPPGHVIFVLATTDPQKVEATIRSRTQHLEFRLLAGETLEQLLKDVRDDAGLDLDDDAVSHAVRKGHGSARDALSALDQVAASGDANDIRPALVEVLEGMCEEDASRALVALSSLHATGWGPQQLAVEIVGDLRQAFLLMLSPDLAEVTGSDRERLEDQGKRLGLGRLVRALEALGRSQVEMRDAADPQVVLEVAVVRCSRADLDADTAGLTDRIARLERKIETLGAMGQHPGAATAPQAAATQATPPPPPAPISQPSDGSKPSLGAFRGAKASAPSPASEPVAPRVAEDIPSTSDPVASAEPVAQPPASDEPVAPEPVAVTGHATVVTRDAVASAWTEKILSQLSGMKRGMYSVARVGDVADGVVTLYVPTKPHRDKCLESRDVVEAALVGAFGTPLTIEIVVDGESQAAPALSDAPVDEAIVHTEIIAEAEAIDLDDLVEAPRGAVDDFATSKIFEAFPGAVEEEA